VDNKPAQEHEPMSEYKTRNDLSANAKSESINILNAHLADSIDLALPTKQAHWNIKGLKNRSSQRMLRETILAWLAVCVTFGAFSITYTTNGGGRKCRRPSRWARLTPRAA
jgi:hypothetical protein